MRAAMKALIPALMLALAAGSTLLTTGCGGSFRPQVNESEGSRDARIAKAGTQSTSSQAQQLKDQNVTDADPVPAPGSSSPEIDINKRLEYVDIVVDLQDPIGMRPIAFYLTKPDTWTLIKCEMLSTTSKRYRFQKITSNDGKSLPEVDIFKTRR